MKNLFLIAVLLFSLQTFSQKEKGTITLRNGKVLSGLVKASSSSLKFKENEDAEAIKYDFNEATGATIINSKTKKLNMNLYM